MTIICAWCGKRLKQGGNDVSHGICGACLRVFESRSLAAWPAGSRAYGTAHRAARVLHPTLPLPGFEAV